MLASRAIKIYRCPIANQPQRRDPTCTKPQPRPPPPGPNGSRRSDVPSRAMLEAEGLVKRYGATVALAGVDLSVPAGAILGVLGPNGAGKTTAIDRKSAVEGKRG